MNRLVRIRPTALAKMAVAVATAIIVNWTMNLASGYSIFQAIAAGTAAAVAVPMMITTWQERKSQVALFVNTGITAIAATVALAIILPGPTAAILIAISAGAAALVLKIANRRSGPRRNDTTNRDRITAQENKPPPAPPDI